MTITAMVILLVVAVALSTLATSALGEPHVLADNGKSDYRIIVSRNASPSEKHAARELQHFLKEICGAILPIVTDRAKATGHDILLGDNEHLRRLRTKIDFQRLGDEGFTIRTVGQNLVIAGGRKRGTMYGVYTFLEDYLGCRWFSSKVSHIPKMSRIEIGAIDDTQVPVFEYREPYYTDAFDGDWAARNKMNGNAHRLKEEHGGKVSYGAFVHTFDALVPPALYEQNPEYFPLVGGKRLSGYVQRCLSNPDVLRLTIEKVRQWIRENPTATVFSVSQNDTHNYCQCEQCKALDDAEGSPSASLLNFVNKVAEAIEKEFPDKVIDTLAYQYTRKPPKTIRPRPNVIVRLCSIECCFSHPLESCDSEANRRFREDIEAWSKTAGRLYVWDYVTNFAHYIMPFPNFDVLQANIRFFARHNVKGVFEEGNYSGGGGGEFAELRAYVLAKLLWNPDYDVNKAINEFLEGYYGKAAPAVRAYLDLLHRKVRDENIHVHIYDPPTAAYLSPDTVRLGDALFEVAERLAEDEEVSLRVQVARLPIWYVKIATLPKGDLEKARLIDAFLAVAEKAGITHISEGNSLTQWKAEVKGQ